MESVFQNYIRPIWLSQLNIDVMCQNSNGHTCINQWENFNETMIHVFMISILCLTEMNLKHGLHPRHLTRIYVTHICPQFENICTWNNCCTQLHVLYNHNDEWNSTKRVNGIRKMILFLFFENTYFTSIQLIHQEFTNKSSLKV